MTSSYLLERGAGGSHCSIHKLECCSSSVLRTAGAPTLCDQSLMKHLPHVQVVPGRNGPARLSAKVLAVDSSLLFEV